MDAANPGFAGDNGSRNTFPRKLYELLESSPPAIVGWLPDGTSFRVIDEALFCERVLPRHFSHSKMASFQRQLNIYGFRRVIKVSATPVRSPHVRLP